MWEDELRGQEGDGGYTGAVYREGARQRCIVTIHGSWSGEGMGRGDEIPPLRANVRSSALRGWWG